MKPRFFGVFHDQVGWSTNQTMAGIQAAWVIEHLAWTSEECPEALCGHCFHDTEGDVFVPLRRLHKLPNSLSLL